MEVMSAVIAFLTGLLILATFHSMNPALAGLALSYSVQMSGLFQFTARLFIETEARFTSVQRILKYCGLTRLEKGKIDDGGDDKSRNQVPDDRWPSEGAVRFEGVSLRYRENLPQALRDVSLDLQAGEKVGVVGQTGAGESLFTYRFMYVFLKAKRNYNLPRTFSPDLKFFCVTSPKNLFIFKIENFLMDYIFCLL